MSQSIEFMNIKWNQSSHQSEDAWAKLLWQWMLVIGSQELYSAARTKQIFSMRDTGYSSRIIKQFVFSIVPALLRGPKSRILW